MQQAALIVAHGFPSDPTPQEHRLKALARDVAAHLPGWQVRGATLAAPGALEAALDAMAPPLVYPFFMAEGWFTGSELPRRLAGRAQAQLAPFGVSPRLDALITATLAASLADQGWQGRDTGLLLAAHGSQRSRTSADSTYALADRLRATMPWREIRCGFIEEDPRLASTARDMGQAICLPFFALTAGHVLDDLPQALTEAAFAGPLLPPIGMAPDVAALIAADLHAALPAGA